MQRHFGRHYKSDVAFYKEILDPEPNAGYVVIEIEALVSTTPRCTRAGRMG